MQRHSHKSNRVFLSSIGIKVSVWSVYTWKIQSLFENYCPLNLWIIWHLLFQRFFKWFLKLKRIITPSRIPLISLDDHLCWHFNGWKWKIERNCNKALKLWLSVTRASFFVFDLFFLITRFLPHCFLCSQTHTEYKHLRQT